ncbi:MAG: zinc ribbon domain-containing protein [Acidilobaceae archaeon]
MIVRRAIVVKLPNIDCDIMRLQALTNLAYRYKELEICPEDLPRTACTMLYKKRFDLEFGIRPKKWFARQWLPMTVLRIQNGARRGDGGAPLLLDLDRGVMRLRSICRAEAPIPRWVYDRIEEGGDIVFARLGLKDGIPAVMLVAERYVEPYKPESLLPVDVNSWKHGIAWALIKNGRIASEGRERPNLRFIDNLYKKSVRLDELHGRLVRIDVNNDKLDVEAQCARSKLYRYLRDYSQWPAGKIVRKALKHRSKVVIDNALEESWRDLLEEGLPRKEAKIYIAGVRRFIKILETQLRWHGVPYEFKRLPSRVCPNCEIEMEELLGRRMKCPRCGLEEDRDKIPILWALKLA